ncbi:MAG: amidohydrolase family protein [Candidatus Rokuibacteriota bacterium]
MCRSSPSRSFRPRRVCRSTLPPDLERHLLADDQRLRLHGLGRRLVRGRRDRGAPDRPARARRFPNIKYVVPHLGGIIPMLLQRLDNQAPRQHPNLPERPIATARRFYYDIVGHGSQAALLCAWKAFGADHLVAGSDYPVLLAFETYRQNFYYLSESSLPAADVDRIFHHNAQIVLGLPH